MKRYFLLLFLSIITVAGFASEPEATPDSIPVAAPAPKPSYPGGHFAWGGSAGASADMSGHDMSRLDVDIIAGYRYRWINFIGAGVGAEMMVSNGSRLFPIYGEFRTNFRNRPSLVFWDLKMGASLNYVDGNDNSVGLFGGTGIGFNVAKGTRYTTHIMLGYTFTKLPDFDLHAVALSIGVTFH